MSSNNKAEKTFDQGAMGGLANTDFGSDTFDNPQAVRAHKLRDDNFFITSTLRARFTNSWFLYVIVEQRQREWCRR
jgi:hypothetical protein